MQEGPAPALQGALHIHPPTFLHRHQYQHQQLHHTARTHLSRQPPTRSFLHTTPFNSSLCLINNISPTSISTTTPNGASSRMPSTSLLHTLHPRANGETESSSLLPLWIILGVGVALAIGWFALSSCLGDNARAVLTQRVRNLFSRNRSGGAGSYGGGTGGNGASRSAYGRMRDDEAEAFDIDAAEHDLYDDLEPPHQPYDPHSTYPPSHSAAITSKYDDVEDDIYDRRP